MGFQINFIARRSPSFPYSEMDKLVLEQNKQRFVIGSSQEVAEFFHQQEELG